MKRGILLDNLILFTLNAGKKVKRKLRYPKLFTLSITIIFGAFLFAERDVLPIHQSLLGLGYFSTFIAGVFFAHGFTAAPATAILLILAKDQNIFLAGIIAGLGALVGDLIILKLIQHSFSDELKKLSRERIVRKVTDKIPLKKYLTLLCAGFIIASPLPDEMGIFLLSMSKDISLRLFSILSFVLNTMGIFVILGIGNLI